MKKGLFLSIIIFNSIALIGIFLSQVYWMREAYQLKEEQFSNSVKLAIKGVANEMEHYMLHYSIPAGFTSQSDSTVYLPDIRDINAGLLDAKMNEELKSLQAGQGFEYAVIDKQDNSFLTGNYKDYPRQLISSRHQIPMTGFKDSDHIVLSVYIPKERNLILTRMTKWLALSATFTLILILAYFYSIYIFYRQKRLSEMKSDFINNMTHEFKTPLATISLASEMLMKKAIQEDPLKMYRYTRIIYDENSRLQNHVEQILRVAQLEKGRFRLRKKETDVHEVIQKILENFELTLKERGGELKSHFCAKEHIVMADPMHLANVITNLLDNSDKYSPYKPEIKIGTYNDALGIVISVEDKGIGIRAEDQRHIFKNLYRVPTGNIYNREKGFGIGLYYVKTIVEAHGGHIKLKSELGKGSRFDIYLPFISNQSSTDHEEFKET